MKKFKKIYIEITNNCNLRCSFCSIDKRKKDIITLDKMEYLLSNINDYTDYIYLHVKGEPLLHPHFKEILDLCEKYNKYVNITTNGTLLKERLSELNHSIIRQINISLHSENNKLNYLNDIFYAVDNLKDKIVVYRFWALNNSVLDDKMNMFVKKIVEHYNLSTEYVEKIKTEKHIKIKDTIFVDKKNEFIWPNIKNHYYNESGFCYALKDHLAILVDGTIVPCCLDSEGIIGLGNIYKDSLENIINSDRYQIMKTGFCNKKVTEELCKHCNFKNLLHKNQLDIEKT